MIVCKVWLGWGEKLHKFWEGKSRLQEGRAGMLCAFSRMNSQQGLDSQICIIFQRNGLSCIKGSRQGFVIFFGELPGRLAARITQFPEGTTSWLLGSLAARTVQFPEGTASWLLESLAARTAQFLEGTASWLLGSLAARTVQFLEGTTSWLLGSLAARTVQFLKVTVVGCSVTGNRNCAIPVGNR